MVFLKAKLSCRTSITLKQQKITHTIRDKIIDPILARQRTKQMSAKTISATNFKILRRHGHSNIVYDYSNYLLKFNYIYELIKSLQYISEDYAFFEQEIRI